MASPYANRPAKTYWRSGVAQRKTLDDLYEKRFEITREHRIATAGSCFAQHIARNLRDKDFNVIDAEPGPARISSETAARYGYGLYSARYGNIYTSRQLLQLWQEAFGEFEPQDAVWTKDGRFYDALRPNVEPEGFATVEELRAHRARHLERVRDVFSTMDVMVFTFGLTEAWLHRASGTVYPTAPETIAGTYSPEIHEFRNFSYDEVLTDFLAFRDRARAVNPDLKFLITVSPVPLNATATDHHVLTATMQSKAILRAVAGELYARCEDVDYFPSFELIGSPFVGMFFEEDMRSVSTRGVQTVMRVFFANHDTGEREIPAAAAVNREDDMPDELGGRAGRDAEQRRKDRVICEDELLSAFSQ